jgi:hypothetical protein
MSRLHSSSVRCPYAGDFKEYRMPDYVPLDLGALANVSAAVYESSEEPVLGSTALHGLPFLIGGVAPDPTRCFIGLGFAASEESISIAVGSAARHILFAHALLDSQPRMPWAAPLQMAGARSSILRRKIASTCSATSRCSA